MEAQSEGGCAPSGPRPSRKMYRSLAGDPFGAASASRNQACRFEVWFGTMSMMTLIPHPCSPAVISSKSASVPSRGSTSR